MPMMTDIERRLFTLEQRLETALTQHQLMIVKRADRQGLLEVFKERFRADEELSAHYSQSAGEGMLYYYEDKLIYQEKLHFFQEQADFLSQLEQFLDQLPQEILKASGTAIPQDGGKTALLNLAAALQPVVQQIKTTIINLKKELP